MNSPPSILPTSTRCRSARRGRLRAVERSPVCILLGAVAIRRLSESLPGARSLLIGVWALAASITWWCLVSILVRCIQLDSPDDRLRWQSWSTVTVGPAAGDLDGGVGLLRRALLRHWAQRRIGIPPRPRGRSRSGSPPPAPRGIPAPAWPARRHPAPAPGAARWPAFSAPAEPMATAATGTPRGGIWTMA